MKKILRTLLMLTCVLGLTACGSSETISDFQQSKIEQAKSISADVVEIMSLIGESENSTAILDDYNNIELADWFSYNYQSYTGSSFECSGKGVRAGITSFAEGMNTIGGIVSTGEITATYNKDDITVNVPVIGIYGNANVELIFSNDIYFNMSACTLNVNESKGQIMARAGLNTLIGMGTVFLVLILISLIISLFGFIPNIQNAFKKKAPVQTASVETAAPVVESAEELSDDTELVAVIAAAIAAYEGTSADGFQVRSIKRANTKNWKKQ